MLASIRKFSEAVAATATGTDEEGTFEESTVKAPTSKPYTRTYSPVLTETLKPVKAKAAQPVLTETVKPVKVKAAQPVILQPTAKKGFYTAIPNRKLLAPAPPVTPLITQPTTPPEVTPTVAPVTPEDISVRRSARPRSPEVGPRSHW